MSIGLCGHTSPTSYSNKVCRCEGCRDRHRIYRRERHHANRDENNKKLKASYYKHRARRLDDKLFQAYGIDRKRWDEILEAQGGVCAICKGGPECGANASSRKFHVDHCHKTKTIRGILCAHCNRAIGLLRDDPQTIRQAAAYLEENCGGN